MVSKIFVFFILMFSILAHSENKGQFSDELFKKKASSVDLLNESLESRIADEQAIQKVPEGQSLQVGLFFSVLRPRRLRVSSNGFSQSYDFAHSPSLIGVDYQNYSALEGLIAPGWGGRFSLAYGSLQEFSREATRLHLAPLQLSFGKKTVLSRANLTLGLGHTEMIYVQRGIDEMNFSGRTGFEYFEVQISRLERTGSRMNLEWSGFFQQNLTAQGKDQDFRGQNIGLGVSFIL